VSRFDLFTFAFVCFTAGVLAVIATDSRILDHGPFVAILALVLFDAGLFWRQLTSRAGRE
jgi:hypothetical protein